MLRREYLRRYLLALLWHDDVPQDAECGTGFLWTNCDGERAGVHDHGTHQLYEDAEAGYNLRQGDVAIVFGFERVSYLVEATEIDRADFSLWIDVIAHDADGRRRQDLLDKVEERIFYRILSYSDFTDAQTGDTLRSFLRWMDGNRLQVESRDDSDSDGDYTVRRLSFQFSSKECVKKGTCGDVPLCFDFSQLAALNGGCDD
jgi:hypothetical protein